MYICWCTFRTSIDPGCRIYRPGVSPNWCEISPLPFASLNVIVGDNIICISSQCVRTFFQPCSEPNRPHRLETQSGMGWFFFLSPQKPNRTFAQCFDPVDLHPVSSSVNIIIFFTLRSFTPIYSYDNYHKSSLRKQALETRRRRNVWTNEVCCIFFSFRLLLFSTFICTALERQQILKKTN